MRRFLICLLVLTIPVFAAPAIYDGGVVNGADFTLNFSPGMLVSVFGTNLATATKVAPGFPLPASIDGVSVEVIDGARTLNAPLFFVSAGQINAQLPFDITSASVQVRVRNSTGTSGTQTINIAARCPRILTKTMNGLGEAIVTHADYTVVSTEAPALAGEIVILYLAGLGAVSPSIAAGQAAGTGTTANPLNVVQDEVLVKVDGAAAKVHYKGLAPYFAGLYQLNFQVPETAQQGINELTVEMGAKVSQGRVQFAVARATADLSAGTIPSAGGTLTGGGLSMSVPAGAFSSAADVSIVKASTGLPVDTGRMGDVYGIEGLPSSSSAPITLAVDFTGTVPAGLKPYLAVQMPGYDGGIMYLAGTVEGNRLVATLPAATTKPVAGVARREARRDFHAVTWVWMTMLGGTYTSEDGRFYIHLTPGISFLLADPLARDFVNNVLTPAVDELQALGFRWPEHEYVPGKPRMVEVSVAPLSGAERLLHGGDVFYGASDGVVRIRLNERLIKNTATTIDATPLYRKVVHVLFHYMRHPDTAPDASYPWLWMDEAVATWLEKKLAWQVDQKYVPLQEEAFWNFAPRGLEVSAATTDREDLLIHGWGASRFLGELLLVKGSTLIKEIYKVHATPLLGALKPVEALRADVLPANLKVNLGDEWERWVYRMGPDAFLLSDRTNLADAVGSREGTLQGKASEKITFSWSAPHLSAQLFQVNLPAQWGSGSVLSAAAAGDSDIVVYYYRVPASGSPVELAEQNAFVRNNPGTVFKSGDRLWIVAVNKKAVSPFTSRTPVAITVQVQTPATYMTQIRKANYVLAGIEAMPICTYSDKKYETMGLCPPFLTSENVIISGTSSKRGAFTPTGWQQEFTVSDTGTTSSGSGSYTMSFSFNEAGDTLLKGTVERRSTYRNTSGQSLESTMKLTITDLPHVWPDTPTSTVPYQTFQEVGATAAKYVIYSYSVTVDGNTACTVTGIDWTRSLLAGKNARRESGTPGVRVYLDNIPVQ
jgi:uncharacterized protein (TIGR03437 family)